MNLGSWIVLAVLVLIVALAIRSIVNDHKSGKGSCGGCTGCSGGAKPASCSAVDDMVRHMEKEAGKAAKTAAEEKAPVEPNTAANAEATAQKPGEGERA